MIEAKYKEGQILWIRSSRKTVGAHFDTVSQNVTFPCRVKVQYVLKQRNDEYVWYMVQPVISSQKLLGITHWNFKEDELFEDAVSELDRLFEI